MPRLISPEEVERRFFESIEPEPMSGCWLWTGKVNPAGYGERHKVGFAHRYAWTKLRGPIPDGLWLDHKCRVRSCVNPDHLRPVTPRENSVVNSLGVGAINAAKTHCIRGHAFDKVTIVRGVQRRMCSSCDKAKSVRRAAAQKEARHAAMAAKANDDAMAGDGIVYAVRHGDGRWLSRKAFDGHGLAWSESFAKGVLYRSPGLARAQVTVFVRDCPEQPYPTVVPFALTQLGGR